MKKIIISIVLIIFALTSKAQYLGSVNSKLHYTWLQVDSALHIPVRDCVCSNFTDSLIAYTTPEIFAYSNSGEYQLYLHIDGYFYNILSDLDSTVLYATPTQVLSEIASAVSNYYPVSNPNNYSSLPNVLNSLQVVNINSSAGGIQVGVYSGRPSATGSKNFYVATDSLQIYYDNGSWITIAKNINANNGLTDSSGIIQLGGTINKNTNISINSPYTFSIINSSGDSINLYTDSITVIAPSGFLLSDKAIPPYYNGKWGPGSQTAYGHEQLSIFGYKPGIELLEDTIYNTLTSNIIWRNARVNAPKLSAGEYGPNAIASIQVGTAIIGPPKWVVTMAFTLGDSAAVNGNTVPLELESVGQDFFGYRNQVTADVWNALFVGSNPTWLGTSTNLAYLPDTSLFAIDLWNYPWYAYNILGNTYDSTVKQSLLYNTSTHQIVRSNYALPTGYSVITKQSGSSYAISSSDVTVIFTGSTSSWTFPTATLGKIIRLVNHGTGNVTLGTSVTLANGSTTTSLPAGSSYQVQYDGSLWQKIN